MSVKFLQPPSPESRAFACVHRLSRNPIVRMSRAAVEAPLSEAQRSALEATQDAAAHAGAATPLPAAPALGRFQGWRVP